MSTTEITKKKETQEPKAADDIRIRSAKIQKEKPPVSEEVLNEGMIRAYIGPKADKMYDKTVRGRGINIFAIIFTYFYMIYRKMYLQAIGAYVLVTIVVSVIPDILPLSNMMTTWFNGICTFLPGFFFYPLYRRHVRKKIDQIKKTTPGLNYNKLVAVSEVEGGTNILVTSIFAIIYLVFMISMIAGMFGVRMPL